MNTNDMRQHVHSLIDQLPPAQLIAIEGLLTVILDPVAQSIANAPVEGEEITPEMAAELDAARAALERGEGIPHEQVLREFGIVPN